ncbi:hypothetical protein [Paenibacillus alkalitolerans]|uniref:hypothetical protein n=1 Tax=Paenibacillus alkalitolerans TaxID=2799335 RepID=UPI0018F5463C|nr:hypothetical protein [Paenibacillus alkalitolerans]
MENNENNLENLEKYRKTDSIYEGRDRKFMTLDAWNQDGNPGSVDDAFGPVMEQEDPPTLNGQPLE